MKTHTLLPALLALACLVSGTRAGDAPGPATWDVQKSGVADDLHAVTFVNDQVGWAVGSNNTILRTADGGKTWQRQTKRNEDGPHFSRVLFTSAREGWAMNTTQWWIFHTTDGGDSWQEMPAVDLLGGHNYAHAALGKTLFVLVWGVSGNHLYRTDNAGKDWQELTTKIKVGSLGDGGASLSFPTPETGYYTTRYGAPATAGHAGVSADGGKSWRDRVTDDKDDKDQNKASGNSSFVQFLDVKTGWFLPQYGTVHATTDGGKTWTPQHLGHESTHPLEAMHFADVKLGHVLCGSTPEDAEVRRTSDGGGNWASLGKLKKPGDVHGLSFPSVHHGWVVGEKGHIEHFHSPEEK